MKRTGIIGAACVLPLLLGACEDHRTLSADARICLPFTPAPATGSLGGEAATLDDCLHHSAYRLARAEDPAETIATAVVASCTDALSRWNTAAVNTPNQGEAGETTDLVTGQSASPLAHRYQFTQGRALYYVVQARAGHCALPDAASR